MKNKLMIRISALAILSTSLFAIDGKHLGLAQAGVNGNAICIYCHTPHAANNLTVRPTPLWNKRALVTTFETYGKTIAGTVASANPTDQTLACLSCHDGVNAMNSVINAPGSGLTGRFASNPLDPSTIVLNGNGGTFVDRMERVATKAVGFDGLANDHPVSIQYVEGRGSLRPVDTPLTGWLGANKIKDLLRGPNQDMVQCSSCHDPHNDLNRLYRRFPNENGSGLCFGCHDK